MSTSSPLDAFGEKLAWKAKTVEHVASVSSRSFVMRELNGAEARMVDGTLKDFAPVTVLYRRVAASLLKINDLDVPMLNSDKDITKLMSFLSIGELDELAGVYTTSFMVKGDDLKKESGSTGEPSDEPTPGLPG